MLLRKFCSLSESFTKGCYPLLTQSRSVILQPLSATAGTSKYETFEEKNLRLKRPLSPHLTIYKPQLTTILSITHRVTGIAVTGYVFVVALSSSYDLQNVITTINNLQLSPATLFLLKTVLALPVSYHVLNGIRHLIWDAGRSLTIKGVYTSGYVALAGTIVLSIFLASL